MDVRGVYWEQAIAIITVDNSPRERQRSLRPTSLVNTDLDRRKRSHLHAPNKSSTRGTRGQTVEARNWYWSRNHSEEALELHAQGLPGTFETVRKAR
jgi:hypothetical protein